MGCGASHLERYIDTLQNLPIPEDGLHEVLRVTICGTSGMRDAAAAATRKSAAVVMRNLFQPILAVACIQAKTVTKGRLNNDKANMMGKVRLEYAAARGFMHSRRSEALITICLEEGGINNKRVGGGLWGDVYEHLQTGWLWGWTHHPKNGRRHLQSPIPLRTPPPPPQERLCKAQWRPRECVVCPARQARQGYACQGIL